MKISEKHSQSQAPDDKRSNDDYVKIQDDEDEQKNDRVDGDDDGEEKST